MINVKYILFAFGTYNDYMRNDFILFDSYPYIIALIIVIMDIKSQEFLSSIDKDDYKHDLMVKSINLNENDKSTN